MCFFFSCYGGHLDLHSFPTRRSSDLSASHCTDPAGPFAPPSATRLRTSCRGRRAPAAGRGSGGAGRSEEHTSELQSHSDLVCRLLLEKKKIIRHDRHSKGPGSVRSTT